MIEPIEAMGEELCTVEEAIHRLCSKLNKVIFEVNRLTKEADG